MLLITHELQSEVANGGPARPMPQLLTAAAAGELWAGLLAGRSRIAAQHCGESMCHLELATVPQTHAVPLHPTLAATLERLLCGQAQKVLALDFGCSCSTITTRAQRAIEQIGLGCSASNAPVLLVMLAHTAWGSLQPGQVYLCDYPAGSGRQHLSVPRPDPRRLDVLSPAEAVLVSMMTAAFSRRDMAFTRDVSLRTIANQLAQVYRKLGVSSRIQLMIRLAQVCAAAPRTAPHDIARAVPMHLSSLE